MNEFFRNQPLKTKLFLLGILPLAFISYLTWQLYIEKNNKKQVVNTFILRIKQIEFITGVINELQLEEKSSYDFLMGKGDTGILTKQRKYTDEALRRLDEVKVGVLEGFEQFTDLSKLQETRKKIDARELLPDQVTQFYSNTIFRINTLNGSPYGSVPELVESYREMQSQKLITDITTYFGIIKTNIYNILSTREYETETLLGSYGAFKVLKSYNTEFEVKAGKETLGKYRQLKQKPSLAKTFSYLEKTFSKFRTDSTLTADEWWTLSNQAQQELLNFRKQLWNTVNFSLEEAKVKLELRKNRTIFLLVAFTIIIFAYIGYIISIITQMLNELKTGAERIAIGNSGIRFHIKSKDVIGSLAESITKIDDNNRRIAEAAEQIGKRDFSTTLLPRSGDDQLAEAIANMKNNLQHSIIALQKSEHRFKQLSDLTPQIIWTSGPDGIPRYYNKKWFDYAGDKNVWDVVHPDEQESIMKEWNHCVETGKVFEMEIRLKSSKTGEYRWFLVRAIGIEDEAGQANTWFGTSTDIHDQKTMNEQLEKLVEKRTMDLTRSNDDLMQFAHVASHDIKEPLRKIRFYADRLEAEQSFVAGSKPKTYVHKIASSAERLSILIDGILKFSSIDDNTQPAETFDLNVILAEVMNDLELTIQQKKAVIISDSLPVITGTRVLIYQLFYNLIINSLKFSREDIPPVIHVKSILKKINGNAAPRHVASGRYLQLNFTDNGIGFTNSLAEKVFDVFARVHDRDKYEGTGLGLALCKKIVERHDGYIYAKSEENAGSEFTILLPMSMVIDRDNPGRKNIVPANAG
jgi:PAS domain S-box-containing protein